MVREKLLQVEVLELIMIILTQIQPVIIEQVFQSEAELLQEEVLQQ